MKICFFLFSICFFLFSSALAAEQFSTPGKLIVSDRFSLFDRQGIEYHLAGLYWPQQDLHARNSLQKILDNSVLYYPLPVHAYDRYRRAHIHLCTADRRWINGLLVAQGLALFKGQLPLTGWAKRLLQLEKTARNKNRGNWGNGRFQIYSALNYQGPFYKFVLISGQVFSATKIRKRIYLNFESDWRQDMTIAINAGLWSEFSAAGITPDHFAGRNITARGWLRNYNGPYMEIVATGQITHDLAEISQKTLAADQEICRSVHMAQ